VTGPRVYVQGPQVLAEHPEWDYLFFPGLPARPAADAEAADYATRATDPEWQSIYAPGLPMLLPAPHHAPADTVADPDPVPADEPGTGPAAPVQTAEEAAADEAQRASEASLARWARPDTSDQPAATPERDNS
jgi:hypothetical protein